MEKGRTKDRDSRASPESSAQTLSLCRSHLNEAAPQDDSVNVLKTKDAL